MMTARTRMTVTLVGLWLVSVTSAFGQAWIKPYEAGLAAAKTGSWTTARGEFQKAIANRPDDQSLPTILPGPPTEQKKWRNGSPYSPNFLAAYAGYRAAIASKDATEQSTGLNSSATELESLLTKGQASREALFFLDVIYTKTSNAAKRAQVLDRSSKAAGKFDWKVDTEIVAPEELGAMGLPTQATQPGVTTQNPAGNTVTPGQLPVPGVLGTKFALVIGQSTSKIGGAVPYAVEDAQRIKSSLVDFAGYPAENVDLVTNATAAQIMASAKALASRAGEGSPIFIYFAGTGVNIAGKDYLACVDTESATDNTSMVAKLELYQLFMAKGARIFAFFESDRTVINGFYFGQEQPQVGAISQSQATLPDDVVSSVVRNGQQVGLYADAIAQVLSELKSPRIPITEFGWQVFYKMRRGNSGTTGGASRQTCTLPALSNLASDARF